MTTAPRLLARMMAVVAGVTLVSGGVAVADQFQPDGDALIGNGTAVNRLLGTLAAGSSQTITVGAAVRSSGNNHVTFPVAVTMSETSPLLSGLSPTSGNVPSYTAEVTTNVTVNAPSTGLTCGVLNGFTEKVDFASSAANLNPNQVSVNVQFSVQGRPCNTAPSVAVTGVTDGASYEYGSVPAAGCAVTDNEDGPSTFAASLTAPFGPLDDYGLGSVTASCSYTDAGGLNANDSASYTIVDTTAPTLNTPGDMTVPAVDANGATASFSATASDTVDGDPVVVCAPPSGSLFPLGDTTVSCSATDAAGNSSNGTFLVKVRDQSAPSLTMPADMTLEATSPAGAVATFAPTVSDNVDTVAQLIANLVCVPPSGSTFPLGSNSVSCTVTDQAGNSSNGSFSVSVVDTTPPDLSVPDDITAEATSAAGAVVTFTAPFATDIVDTSPDVQCTHSSGETFPLGTTTVNCSATDDAGNPSYDSFVISVVDTTPPSLPALGNINATATSANGAAVNYITPTATDAVDPSPTVVCLPPSGSSFGLGDTTVTCTATDFSGNQSSKSFHVYVSYSWSGLLQPVNTDGSSIFKQGSTVPVKFRLTGASAGTSNAVAKLYVALVTNNVAGTDLEAVSTSAADTGNQFRYDASGGQYIFNLATKPLVAGTYRLRIDLGDGVLRTVNISLKK